jgi:type IV secretion system protein TrbG
MRSRSLGFVLLISLALTGCATFKPPLISYDDEQPAILQADPPKPVQVVELPKPLPLPGQLKPLPGVRSAPEPRDHSRQRRESILWMAQYPADRNRGSGLVRGQNS